VMNILHLWTLTYLLEIRLLCGTPMVSFLILLLYPFLLMYRNWHILSFANELVNEKKDTQYSEEGYRGTLLTSNVSSQVNFVGMHKIEFNFLVQYFKDISVCIKLLCNSFSWLSVIFLAFLPLLGSRIFDLIV
jgi:hypothetical protein